MWPAEAGFKRFWHDRRVDLADGDTLRWLVIARPERPPLLAPFRSHRRGGLHPARTGSCSSSWATPDAVLEELADRLHRPMTHEPRVRSASDVASSAPHWAFGARS